MRVGLDGIPLGERKTGVGHYTFELAHALALAAPSDKFELVSPFPFLPPIGGEGDPGLPPNLRTVRARLNSLNRYWWAVGLPRYIKQNSLTLFHGTNYEVPLWRVCPTVLTIHDLSLFRHPETHETQNVRRGRRRLPLMARIATMIVTPTECVRREVCHLLNTSPDKVVAVPEAPRRIFRRMPPEQTVDARGRLGVEEKFLLFVGTIEPRKNLLTLVRAFAEVLRVSCTRIQLVITGRKGWLTDDLFAYINKSGVADRLCFTGYVSDDDLCALYSSCSAFVYPSTYEGFGLPPLEAMACGAPVIASRIPSILEVVGKAAHLVAPEDVGALAQSIMSVLEDKDRRRCLSTEAVRRAAEFSWERTARSVREVYCEALRRVGRK